jgi:hypothetical protein
LALSFIEIFRILARIAIAIFTSDQQKEKTAQHQANNEPSQYIHDRFFDHFTIPTNLSAIGFANSSGSLGKMSNNHSNPRQ